MRRLRHMNTFVHSTAPDLKLGSLALWVHGREFENATDYWDGNWLHATARCGAVGAAVTVSGPFVRITELLEWASDSRGLLAGARDSAELATIEPELKVVLTAADSLGHLEMVVEITPDHVHQEHKFTFEIDQSYLPPLIASIERLASKYPVRGAPNERT